MLVKFIAIGAIRYIRVYRPNFVIVFISKYTFIIYRYWYITNFD